MVKRTYAKAYGTAYVPRKRAATGMLSGAAAGLGALANAIYNMKTTQNENNQTHRMVTTAEPTVSLYRKKYKRKTRKARRFQRYKRYKARSFAKRVKKALFNKAIINTCLNQYQPRVITSNTTLYSDYYWNAPICDDYSMVMCFGTNYSTASDLPLIHENIRNIGWVSDGYPQDQNKAVNVKYLYKATMKINIFRPPWTSGQPGYTDLPIDYDVYECTAAQDIASSSYKNPYQTLNTLSTGAQTFNADTKISLGRVGMTPFDVPNFGSWWKIDRVSRIRLGVGQKADIVMNSKGIWDYDRFTTKFAIKGKTRACLIIARPTICGPISTTSFENCTIISQKVFKFKPYLKESFTENGIPITMEFSALSGT